MASLETGEAWAFLLKLQSIATPALVNNHIPLLDLHSGLQGDLYPALLLQSPEKAELEAAGDLGHLQGVR